MPAAVLGVERSVDGKLWRARLGDDRRAAAIAQRLGVPEIVGRVLAGRGVELENADRYLNPRLKELLPDPFALRDMERAVDRLVAAVRDREPIAVFGDYDVDGATSSAVLHRFLAAIGVPLRIYIPDRIKEGYGPNADALRRLAEEGVRVVVTVDCGISSFDALEAGAAAGLDIIIVDHHKAEPRLPAAHAVVNPNRLDDDSGLGRLAAVGVTFMLVVALNARLRQLGWYGAGTPEPDLRYWLDLVALGTVCDMVPLQGLNRAFVVQGVKVLAARHNTGLAALSDVAGLRERPGAYHLGYLLGPRVNAGGRVGRSDLGARLMTTDDPGEAAEIANQLDLYNRERQEIEQAVLAEAIAAVDSSAEPLAQTVVAGEGWHPGVIGIVASRLVTRYNRPACVIALKGERGKGSGRSVPGFDLGAAVIAARQAGLVLDGGGHAMAAGFSVEAAHIDALRSFLAERFAHAADAGSLMPSLGLDGILSVGAATPEFLDLIDQAGPYGAGNAEPRFAFADARIAKADVVGERHVRVFLTDVSGARLRAIAFRAFETELGTALLEHRGRSLHIAGHLRHDNWQGRNQVQLHIEDAATVRTS
ncbi:MAG: single-stranded-DNA-specific exonuclease RecJ [Alphaproteobacteria bacterium]|nr:single-stranded-DNA-specific exonuclease RecJ [Alphaproteobacteria bacterium]